MEKQSKVITRRKKFIEVDLPVVSSKMELLGNTPEDLLNKTIKLDLTRQLKGKSVEGTFKIVLEKNKPTAHPFKIKLMSYFIRRMIRKRISYVEDSFEMPSRESMLLVKPFLITRKKVSRAVRKTLRNKAKNWLEDYISQKEDQDLFQEILTNSIQKPLSIYLKKTYPLSLCEIRVLEIIRKLKPEEIPEIKPKKEKIEFEKKEKSPSKIGEGLDQLEEIEQEKIKKAQEEIAKAQKNAAEKEKSEEEIKTNLEIKPKKKKSAEKSSKSKEKKEE